MDETGEAFSGGVTANKPVSVAESESRSANPEDEDASFFALADDAELGRAGVKPEIFIAPVSIVVDVPDASSYQKHGHILL